MITRFLFKLFLGAIALTLLFVVVTTIYLILSIFTDNVMISYVVLGTAYLLGNFIYDRYWESS